MSDDGGFTKSFRRKWRNPVFRNFRDGGIWSYLCDNAAWQDTTIRFCDRLVTLERGQIAVSERFLAEGFCCDRQVIRRLFDALESAQMITRQKTHGGTIITLCNYEAYQECAKDANPPDLPSQTQVEPTSNPNKKEDKESKEGNLGVARQDAPSTGDKPPSKSRRGSRLPEDFIVPEEWKREAEAYRSAANLPPVDSDTEGIKFTNFFLGASGQKGIKANWKRTFINWILNARAAPGETNGRKFSATESLFAGAALALAERERARDSREGGDVAQPLLDGGRCA